MADLTPAAAPDAVPVRRDEAANRRAANQAVGISAVGLALTGAVELFLALFTGSVGLLGDALHNLSDVSTSAVVFLGFWVSKRPASDRFPYGYERAEDLAGLGVALVIWASAGLAAWESVHKFLLNGPTTHLGWGMVGAVTGVAGNQVVARYKLAVGRRIHSTTLVADARHSWLDAVSSLGALGGLVAVAAGWRLGDPVAGFAVTLLIAHVGWQVTSDVLVHLMDGVEPETLEAARRAAELVGVTVVAARGRWLGRSLVVEVELALPSLLTLAQSASETERVRDAVLAAVPEVHTALVSARPGVDRPSLTAPGGPARDTRRTAHRRPDHGEVAPGAPAWRGPGLPARPWSASPGRRARARPQRETVAPTSNSAGQASGPGRDQAIEALFDERRSFPPPADLAQHALVRSQDLYRQAAEDPEGYWAAQAARLVWRRRWDTVLDWSGAPFAKWFSGGRLNVTESCLDRHLADRGDKVAYHWEGEPGDKRSLTYTELHAEVCRLANALKSLEVGRGDRVAIYMGMVPELPVALLACARLGAPHSVVFGGFSADSLRDRINDARCKVLITCDGSWRNGAAVALKACADQALERAPSITSVVVVRRTGQDVAMVDGRDHWYHELVGPQSAGCPAEEMDAEDILYLLYTSGTTGKPKGIVHTTGGYLTGCATTHRLVFDLHPATDVYWCAADIGWVTGHSYIVYGPLANGATSVLYEGAPSYPGRDRFWDIVERYRVTQLYLAPTAIRTMMKWGAEHPGGHDLSSLRVIGTVGEPINPEAWMWYRHHIGGDRCPVVDTWWQTETGHMMISPLPGVTTTKPGSATFPLPGISADVLDEAGASVPLGGGGYLVLTAPWPGMLRTLYGDDDRFVETYWSRFSQPESGKWVYFAGDGAKRDAEGFYWLLGRVDDVMNVSGHRISTLEVESALVDHPAVAEAAVVGRRDDRTGQAIAAFVTLRGTRVGDDRLLGELREHVAARIGKIARPASIVFTDELPKTRSGKIMRRLLRDVSEQRGLGDVTTLANAEVVNDLAEAARARRASEED